MKSPSTTTPPLRTKPLQVLATPPPVRHYLLPEPAPYFTGELFDNLALFLHKHSITYTSISLVGRGTTRDQALSVPAAIIVDVEASAVTRARALFNANRRLVKMVPEEIGAVVFAGYVVE